MKQAPNKCPKCSQESKNKKAPQDKLGCSRLKVSFKDPIDGDVYRIWKCSKCKYTWMV